MVAGGNPLGVSRINHLLVNFGPTAVKVPFLVCDSLTAEDLLSTHFIYLEVSIVRVRDRFIELADGTEMAILNTTSKKAQRRYPKDKHLEKRILI